MNDKTDWAIEIDGLVKEYGGIKAVDHISLKYRLASYLHSCGPMAPERPRPSRYWNVCNIGNSLPKSGKSSS
ncbi:MAG: hypothetical protein ABSC87_05035 [Halobacteriota archaeon]|jgi:hypothetical protein